ncbi:2,5-didehydrogluconate reductase DkgB [Marinimicrobium sp. ABcell2]|uniref:2,5-didehydrogluconate reductase DkgB n=1 Tax=Marinimicrobium sp. ABcell2 TaxID=3069751 RepID=UPI0027B60EF9|nr:2,5-didehydrogluconate reductase DkgB [Marinimicrobium sp. ABcell2]MDQ2076932.1 2,5-didehydrogluconate reductase DkgB [Marinimicrobium sp. ABcell2]
MRNAIPALGLGTYRLTGKQAVDSVTAALEIGYRHIDTAQLYDNEADVGQAIAQSGVPRDQVFVTTKIWFDQLSRDRLIPSLEASLERLKMDQVDLALVHWPSPNDEVPMQEYMEGMLEAQRQGLTRLIGVSNFTTAQLKQVDQIIGLPNIATNQVEIQPFLQNKKLAAFARKASVHLTAYMPLACGKVAHEPDIQQIAQKHGTTPAQVTIAWLLQQGFAVIPSSTKRDHLESNWAAQSLKLDDSDLTVMNGLDRGERIANPDFAPVWD